MANELRFVDGDLLFVDGDLAMSADCCCEPPCDCESEGASPVAAFSYEQTDDDPCTLDLFDESTAGTCGEIVAWRWLKNGVEVSTSQNPTGITYADGDDFTSEVTDSEGCTDSAVMEVDCVTLVQCGNCPDELPPTVEVSSSGWSNDNCVGGNCADFNGTYTIGSLNVAGSPPLCEYFLQMPGTANCNGLAGGAFSITVTVQQSGGLTNFRVFFQTILGSGVGVNYSMSQNNSLSCRGPFILPFLSEAGAHDDCFFPASVTLTI